MRTDVDLSRAVWERSSYSNGSGGNCVEVARNFLAHATWEKSSYSNGSGGQCVELARNISGIVPVRDSKNPGTALVVSAGAWQAFVAHVRS